MCHQAYFYWWPRSEELHTNGFLFADGRWHALTRAHSIRILFIAFYGFCIKRNIFLKPQGETLSLEVIANCDDSLALASNQLGRTASRFFFSFYWDSSTSSSFPNFAPKKPNLVFTLWSESARFTFSRGRTAINGVCYWQLALNVRAQEECEAWANWQSTDSVLKSRSVAFFKHAIMILRRMVI